jgi:hypothetical protein
MDVLHWCLKKTFTKGRDLGKIEKEVEGALRLGVGGVKEGE